MTTDVASATLRPGLARPASRARLRLEHVVMGGAIVALIVLVVLPLLFAAARQRAAARRG